MAYQYNRSLLFGAGTGRDQVGQMDEIACDGNKNSHQCKVSGANTSRQRCISPYVYEHGSPHMEIHAITHKMANTREVKCRSGLQF